MKYIVLFFFLIFALVSCKTNFAPVTTTFCYEEDEYDGYDFSRENSDTLLYFLSIYDGSMFIQVESRVDSSAIYIDSILVQPLWHFFNDSLSICDIEFYQIAELEVIPNVPINLDISFNEFNFKGQICIPNNPELNRHGFSNFNWYEISWDLIGPADTQFLSVILRETDEVKPFKANRWQYSGYRRCHLLTPEFFKEVEFQEYRIKTSIQVTNYLLGKKIMVMASSLESYTDVINTSNITL